jgi:hypothetical protein
MDITKQVAADSLGYNHTPTKPNVYRRGSGNYGDIYGDGQGDGGGCSYGYGYEGGCSYGNGGGSGCGMGDDRGNGSGDGSNGTVDGSGWGDSYSRPLIWMVSYGSY